MTRLDDVFSRTKAENRSALVAYLCAGDPDADTTVAAVLEAARRGADIIELGVPFSDPAADGVAIQRASERALAGGMSLKGALEIARRVRAESDVPIVLFGYYNPILCYGEAKLCEAACEAGIDGLLVVDLPPEEYAALREPADAAGLGLVPLLAPTSTPARVKLAAEMASGFVYYVSLTGVTGAASADFDKAAGRARQLAEETGRPVVVGFGVKTAEDARKLAPHADGVVVGSAIVRCIEDANDQAEATAAVGALVESLAGAMPR